MDPNGFGLAATSGAIVFDVNPADARAYADSAGIGVEIVGSAARFNKGFPNGIEPFSREAQAWRKRSPTYEDSRAQWHCLLGDSGC